MYNTRELAAKLEKPKHKVALRVMNLCQLFYSLTAMQLENIKNTSTLIEKFHSQPVLRYNCKFNILHPPTEGTLQFNIFSPILY